MSDTLTAWLGERLSDYAAHYGIPGASAAIIKDGQCATAATGLLNLETRVAATRDALFQIGSITKTFTATLVLQLLEQGRIQLEDPVRRHLPYFAVASSEISETVTVRHLLTHTSGIDGDFFPNTGTDADCIEKYVRACARLGQIHAPDESISYVNAGFIILGAMLQHMTGKTWDALLQERILAPAGLAHSTTDWAELPRFRVAVGHLSNPETKALAVARTLHLPKGMGPTGATLHCSACDLASFGRLFLDHGRTVSETQIVQPDTIALSRELRAKWPTAPWTGLGMGLGWLLYDWGGRSVFGHDGATIGQASYLRIMPEANLSVALLTNGGAAKNLYHALFRDIFRDLADTDLPRPPKAIDTTQFDHGRVVGIYENKSTIAEVVLDAGQFKLKTKLRELAEVFPSETTPLRPVAPDACQIENPALATPDLLVFHHFDAGHGRARFATLNYRNLLRRD